MIHRFIRFLRGYVRIGVGGYSPERFLNMCSYHNIYIWGLMPVKNGYEMYIMLKDFRKIRPFAKKTKTRIKIVKRTGFPFLLYRYRRRKLFFIGILICVIMLNVYSMFIWDIHFEGNEKWTDETLLEFLDSVDVSPFMLRSSVDCPSIVKNIRKEYNDIVWVSASVDGSCLNIHIKENDDTLHQDISVSGEKQPCDLIASKDGVITKIITRSGVPQVHAGDAVKKGQILVSGRIEVLDDTGEVTGYQYTESDADIYADTEMEYNDSMKRLHEEKIYDGNPQYRPFLRIGNWSVSSGGIRESTQGVEISSSERQVKIGENFYLPFSYGVRIFRNCHFDNAKYSNTELQKILSGNFKRFCEKIKENGVQIRDNSVKIHLYENSAEASGILYLNEKITEKADTEIITIERKESDESVGTDD